VSERRRVERGLGGSTSLTPGLLALGFALWACGGTPRADSETAHASTAQATDPDYVCLPGAPERCLNAWDDNCNGLVDEGCGLKTGLAQFLIAWDSPGADVDLDVIDPQGQLAEPGQVTGAGLLKERDCPGRNDDCKGARIENVYLEAGRKLVTGAFTVRVRLAALRDKDSPVQVTLAVRLGDQNHAERFTLRREGETRQLTYDFARRDEP